MVDPSNAAPEQLDSDTRRHDEADEEQSERPAKRARTRSNSPPSPSNRSHPASPVRSPRSPSRKNEQTDGNEHPNGEELVAETQDEKEDKKEDKREDKEEPDNVADDKKEENGAVDTGKDAKTDSGGASAEEDQPSSPEEGEFIPPLPEGPPPDEPSSDGWEAIWEPSVNAYYFYNSITGETTWTNPRVPDADNQPNPIAENGEQAELPPPEFHQKPPRETYNPAIHGDYDPTAPYAQRSPTPEAQPDAYAAQAAFNRFTGRFQAPSQGGTDRFADENKSKRQMEYYFDVDAAANSHDGRSLKAERQGKKLTKAEVKAFRDKRRERKEEKRRAWLKD